MDAEIGPHESVRSAVLRAVSAVTGRDPGSLPPLTEVVDPDALDAVFGPRSTGVPRTGGHLAFCYSGCRVTIDNGEYLTIEPLEPTGRRSPQPDGTDRGAGGSPDRDLQPPGTERPPGSRLCFVCQQPIDRPVPQRERGELVHGACRAERRCGISLGGRAERHR